MPSQFPSSSWPVSLRTSVLHLFFFSLCLPTLTCTLHAAWHWSLLFLVIPSTRGFFTSRTSDYHGFSRVAAPSASIAFPIPIHNWLCSKRLFKNNFHYIILLFKFLESILYPWISTTFFVSCLDLRVSAMLSKKMWLGVFLAKRNRD